MFQKNDVQTGDLEREERMTTMVQSDSQTAGGDIEREERVTTVGTKLEARTFEAEGRSALRYRPINPVTSPTPPQEIDDWEEGPTLAPKNRPQRIVRYPDDLQASAARPARRAAASRQAPREAYEYGDYDEEESRMEPIRRLPGRAGRFARPTEEDEQIAPSVRGEKAQNKKQKRRKIHPTIWILGTTVFLFLAWEALILVPAWFVTTFQDPGIYGPSHGQTLEVKLQAAGSSTLVAINLHGKISLLDLFSDPKQNETITGPDLREMGFPDPAAAEVALESAGPGKVQVTIWSDQWVKPFHRYGITLLLADDGKGHLTQVGAITVIQ